MTLTHAIVRALVAVRAGKVTQVFTATGNTFRGPRSIAAITYRRLESARLIEDAPGQRGGRYIQQLSKAGRDALVPFHGTAVRGPISKRSSHNTNSQDALA